MSAEPVSVARCGGMEADLGDPRSILWFWRALLFWWRAVGRLDLVDPAPPPQWLTFGEVAYVIALGIVVLLIDAAIR